jgi:ABC-type amino acid transport substrate-binding protein
LVAVFLAISLSWLGPAQAEGAPGPTAIVAALNDAPPMAYTNDKGVAKGTLVRIARPLFAAAGLPWSIATYPAPRLIKGLRDGSFNFSMLVRMPELAECCLLSSAPVIVQEPRVYFLNGKTAVTSKEQLAGHSLIVINGYTYAGLIRHINDPANGISTEVAESLDAAFRMLEAGRADYLLSYEANARSVLAKRPIKGLQSQAIGQIPVYLVLSKAYPDAAATMARFESLVRGMDIPAIMAEE